MIVTLFTFFSFNALLGYFEYLTVVLVKLLVSEVGFCYFFDVFVDIFPV